MSRTDSASTSAESHELAECREFDVDRRGGFGRGRTPSANAAVPLPDALLEPLRLQFITRQTVVIERRKHATTVDSDGVADASGGSLHPEDV